MPDVLTIPTTTLASSNYIGPGLPHASSVPDVISGVGGTTPGGKAINLTADSFPDELSSLQPLGLKTDSSDPGIQFPGIMLREEQTKSLAVHLYPNLDSGRVENMGRNPAIFRIRAIFTNNIYPGQNETWTPGLLFPNTFIAVYQLLLGDNNIIFQHPLLGNITVQVRSWSYELNPKQARDGAFMDIELIETIGDQNPLSQQLTSPPGSNMQQAANTLDTAIGGAPSQINLPNMSITQFFGQITNLVSQATSFPNNVVNSLDTPIIQGINGAASIAGALISTPASLVQNTNAAIQNTKNAVLNSPIQAAIANDQATFGSSSPTYDQSTYQAMQSIMALNNQPSQNAFQLMNKIMRALVDLQAHYVNQNNPAAIPVIEAIRGLLLQVQQQQSALSLNTNNQSVKVATFLTPNNMTWMQLASYLANPIDDLMGLNQGLVNALWIPGNTTINYFQG